MPALLGRDEHGQSFMIEEARGLALRRGHWKYIQGKGKNAAELYDLSSDVGEQNNVVKANESIALEMQAMLKRLIDAKQGIRKAGR
jgi:arylsulfatase A-like enzyme